VKKSLIHSEKQKKYPLLKSKTVTVSQNVTAAV